MTDEIVCLWARAAEILKERLNADTFDRWMANIVPVRIDDENIAVLGVSNDMFSDWLRDNFSDVVCEALTTAGGREFRVLFEPGHMAEDLHAPAAPSPEAREQVTMSVDLTHIQNVPVELPQNATPNQEFRHRFSFDTFVVGGNNSFAYNACQAVAQSPGTAYNPLFIHSPVGLGKSHLLQAIALEVREKNPNAVVEYVTTEEFSNHYVYALQHNQLPQFRDKIRNVDVLLMDDVQFLGSKSGFQEEFFHTFNALHGSHKQMVMASDRPPQDINGLEKRLVSRFEWGLTADMQAPDLETRIAIIRKKQESQEVKLSDEVIEYLGATLKSNVRRLEGALNSLVAHAQLEHQTITVEVAERVLEGILREESSSQLTVEQIQRVVAEHYDIRFSDMTSKRRPASIALPRQIAMYLARKHTDLSYPDIAEQFAKNHATILHAVSTIENKMETNQDFKREIANLERKLKR